MAVYNGKTDLLISYHWGMFPEGSEATVIKSEVYDTYDEAAAEMTRIMPDEFDLDDGAGVDDWAEEIEFDDMSLPFVQYVARLQDRADGAYVLARLTVVKG